MRETTFLSKINGYGELKTVSKYKKVIEYVRTGKLPDGLSSRQQTNYKTKYGKASGFEWLDDKLVYIPDLETPDVKLEVVKPSNKVRKEKIKTIYDDEKLGLGVGLEQFYQQVSKRFLNIPKKLTDLFLQKQGDYKITRVPVNKTHLTINTKNPNERWSVDLIDMTMYDRPANRGMKYIFTCVDYFSGKVWARAISNRENGTITQNANRQRFKTKPTLSDALKDIMREAKTEPKIIQVDNEFDKGAFKKVCKDRDIILVAVLSHQSFTNGKVERMNREIRKKTKAGFVRHNNLNWVDYLPDYIENINNQKNARTKRTPNEMWSEGYAHLDSQAERKDALNEIQDKQYDFLNERMKRNKELNEKYVFEKGDAVRVKLLAYSSEMRKKKKNNIGWNQVAIHYSPELYEVSRVIEHRDSATPTEYNIINRQDRGLIYKLDSRGVPVGKRPRRFRGTDLILVPRGSKKTTIDPDNYRTALYLNRILPNKDR